MPKDIKFYDANEIKLSQNAIIRGNVFVVGDKFDFNSKSNFRSISTSPLTNSGFTPISLVKPNGSLSMSFSASVIVEFPFKSIFIKLCVGRNKNFK